MFEILAIAFGVGVGAFYPRFAPPIGRIQGPDDALVRMAAGAVGGLGLATKSVMLTATGAAGVVTSAQLNQLLGVSKASAQADVAASGETEIEVPPDVDAEQLRKAALQQSGLGRPKTITQAKPIRSTRTSARVGVRSTTVSTQPSSSTPTPSQPPVGTGPVLGTQTFLSRGLAPLGKRSPSRAEKLGLVTAPAPGATPNAFRTVSGLPTHTQILSRSTGDRFEALTLKGQI